MGTAAPRHEPALSRRRAFVSTVLAAATAATLSPAWAQAAALSRCPVSWPLWEDFAGRFIQTDGRIIDASAIKTTSSSEGQSYGMFFALVANDAERFAQLWQWSVNNLFDGDAHANLPSWHWGQREDGTWGVLDKNSASDADMWFAYVLIEAARLWHRPDYAAHAKSLLRNIVEREIVDLPGVGPMVLPGEHGFGLADAVWRINPSYLPVFQLRRFAQFAPEQNWESIARSTARMFAAITPKGFAPDWTAYHATGEASGDFIVDPVHGDVGSYDSIRTYLWAGMVHDADPLAGPLRTQLAGLARATQGANAPPETVRTQTGETMGRGPFGFSAALLPYLKATGQTEWFELQRHRVETLKNVALLPEILQSGRPPYYDYVLTLFGMGWADGKYRLERDGRLKLHWEERCPHAATR